MPHTFRELEELIVRITASASLAAVAIKVIAAEWQEHSLVVIATTVAITVALYRRRRQQERDTDAKE
jgi:hypothetical protein